MSHDMPETPVSLSPSPSPSRRAWLRFRQHRLGYWSLLLFCVMVVLSLGQVAETLRRHRRAVPSDHPVLSFAAEGAHAPEIVGAQSLEAIQFADALIVLLKCFDSSALARYDPVHDPLRDLKMVELELLQLVSLRRAHATMRRCDYAAV